MHTDSVGKEERNYMVTAIPQTDKKINNGQNLSNVVQMLVV